MSRKEVEVNIDTSALKRARDFLSEVPGGFEKATSRAINRALTAGQAATTLSIRKNYTVKAAEARVEIRKDKATQKKLSGGLILSGRNVPLDAFTHSPSAIAETTGKNRKQIHVAVKKGSLKPLKTGFKHKGMIRARVTDKGRGIEIKYGPSVPSMLSNSDAVDFVQERMRETFDKRLSHEARLILEESSK